MHIIKHNRRSHHAQRHTVNDSLSIYGKYYKLDIRVSEKYLNQIKSLLNFVRVTNLLKLGIKLSKTKSTSFESKSL